MRLADKCSFCPAAAFDSVTIECGNNAELRILVHFCHDHMAEMDGDPVAFEKKYEAIIDKLPAEHGVTS